MCVRETTYLRLIQRYHLSSAIFGSSLDFCLSISLRWEADDAGGRPSGTLCDLALMPRVDRSQRCDGDRAEGLMLIIWWRRARLQICRTAPRRASLIAQTHFAVRRIWFGSRALRPMHLRCRGSGTCDHATIEPILIQIKAGRSTSAYSKRGLRSVNLAHAATQRRKPKTDLPNDASNQAIDPRCASLGFRNRKRRLPAGRSNAEFRYSRTSVEGREQ